MVQELAWLAPAPSEQYGCSDQVFKAGFEFDNMGIAVETGEGPCKVGLQETCRLEDSTG